MIVTSLGALALRNRILWFRGERPKDIDAQALAELWERGCDHVRDGGDKYVRPFEEFAKGMRQLGLVGANPADEMRPDWVVIAREPSDQVARRLMGIR